MGFAKDLNTPLLKLSPVDYFTLDDATKGIHAFGGIGAGKTTAGRTIAGAYIRAGMGGIVLPAKPGDIAMWQDYAKEHGAARSVVVFDESHGFNFMDHELGRHGVDGIGTVTECMMQVVDSARRSSSTGSSKAGETVWEDKQREVLRYCIPLLYSAYGSVPIRDIVRFVSTAPTSRKEADDSDWQDGSFMYQTVVKAAQHPKIRLPSDVLDNAILFWKERFCAMPDKMLGSVVGTVTGTLDRFLHGRLQRIFCGRTTIVPELIFHGAIIILAMPTLTWDTDGTIAQKIFKFFTQRAILNRNSLALEHRERPVFIWADEAQETVTSYDAIFQSVCRDSRACTVYLTQSLPTYYAKMGGDRPNDDAHALVGKFGNFLFFSNSCPDTNEYAARVIGKAVKHRGTYNEGRGASSNIGTSSGENNGDNSSHNYSSGGTSSNHSSGGGTSSGNNWGVNRGQGSSTNESRGYTEAIEYVIEPGEFARLFRTGGKQNNYEVTGLWYKTGTGYKASGSNILMGVFKQR